MSKRLAPLSIGDRFDDWTVVSEPRKRIDNRGSGEWVVTAQCKCGLGQEIREADLRNKKSKRCRKCSSLLRVKVKFTPGDRLGKWTILGEARFTDSRRAFEIACDCGNKFKVSPSNLKQYNHDRCSKCDKSKYRISSLPEYVVWQRMLARCYDIFHDNYNLYGGRGVTVCDRWNPRAGGSFENFYADMGPRPSDDHQLDKEAVFIDNKVYCPEFVKWTTRRDNCNRKSNSVFVNFNNEEVTLAELAAKFSINYGSLYYKIKKKHLSPEEAVRLPIEHKNLSD